MKLLRVAGLALFASVCMSCASTHTVRYVMGSVTSSNVVYKYVAPPVLTHVNGQAYHVSVTGMDSPMSAEISTLHGKGMRPIPAAGNAALVVHIEIKDVQDPKPGGLGLKGEYYPALIVSTPYRVSIVNARGTTLTGHSGTHEEVLTMKGAPAFPTREEASQATEFMKVFGAKSINQKAKAGAFSAARKDLNSLARQLFENQTISMDVPVVRGAAGVELNHAYDLLSTAKDPHQVDLALRSYEQARRQLGRAGQAGNTTANYGIICGIAACKLMLRDLSGAWEAASLALSYEPRGREADSIRTIIYREEVTTGLNVIPQAEREKIDEQVRTAERWGSILQKLAN